jgi:site-specific DNA recombinase
MQLKIGAYTRVSTEEQAALVDGSLDNQKYRLISFVDLKNVQEKNWGKIVDHYVDDGYSAKDTRRPAFQRMMSDLKKGKINLILVSDLSRLSRNIFDFCILLETLKNYEASFLSIKEQFDSSTPAGKMMLYNMINLAQFEREQTAERVALGCHSRAMRGLLNGGHPIFGFDKSLEKKNSYIVNEEEASLVKIIYKTYLETGSLNRTITKLRDLGIKPKVKQNRNEKLIELGIWTIQSLSNVLKNYAYIGKLEVNRDNKEKDEKTLKAHQKYHVVKASWPAILDEETFFQVQLLLDENKLMERRRLEGAERRVFLASGILRCKECGRPMVGQSAHGQKNVHRYYVHSYSKADTISCSINRIGADEIENAIHNHVSKILLEGNYLNSISERIFAEANSSQSMAKASGQKLKGELKSIEKEMETAFKCQMSIDPSSTAAQFYINKLEDLGKQKMILEKSLLEFKDTDSNVVVLSDVRQDILIEPQSSYREGLADIKALKITD